MSFKLEWWGKTGLPESIAVHVEHLHGRIQCYPALVLDETIAWLDQLLARVPSS